MSNTNEIHKDSRGDVVQVAGSFLTHDATATAITSPISTTANAYVTLKVPSGATQLMINPATGQTVQIGLTEAFGAEHFLITQQTQIDVSNMGTVYLRGTGVASISFMFIIL